MFEELKIWDTHIHLDQYPKEQISQYINRWQEKGVIGIISVAMDLRSSYQLLEWKVKYPDFIHIALGHHPEQVSPLEKDLYELTQLIEREKNHIIAIGEVGIIHYRQQEFHVKNLEASIELLTHFTVLAKSINKPIILHAVHEKAKIALQILQKEEIRKAHFHWFKSDFNTQQEVEKAGYYISLTPEVTFRNRDQRIAKAFNLEQLLLETDGPWPLKNIYLNKVPEPMWIRDSIKAIAEIKKISSREVANIINQNVEKLYFNKIE